MKDLEKCMRYALNARGERPSTCPAVVQGAVEKRHDTEIHRIAARFSERSILHLKISCKGQFTASFNFNRSLLKPQKSTVCLEFLDPTGGPAPGDHRRSADSFDNFDML